MYRARLVGGGAGGGEGGGDGGGGDGGNGGGERHGSKRLALASPLRVNDAYEVRADASVNDMRASSVAPAAESAGSGDGVGPRRQSTLVRVSKLTELVTEPPREQPITVSL